MLNVNHEVVKMTQKRSFHNGALPCQLRFSIETKEHHNPLPPLATKWNSIQLHRGGPLKPLFHVIEIYKAMKKKFCPYFTQQRKLDF